VSRKIVVEPYFNEHHLAEHQIGNMCEYLQPDIFVLSEGLFPSGSEALGASLRTRAEQNTKEVKEKYTLNGEGKRSFDFEALEKTVAAYQKQYPRTQFHILQMDYTGLSTTQCFEKAYNGFKQVVDPQPDDIIFPSECDLFITKEQGVKILELCKTLQPGQAFCCSYLLFFESPRIHWLSAHTDDRRIAYRYGSGSIWGNYDGVPGTSKMFGVDPVHDLKLFHYKWIRPGIYWEFRKKQIIRDSSHHAQADQARQLIQHCGLDPQNINEKLKPILGGRFYLSSLTKDDHPKHFRNHESFKQYYG